MAFHNNENDWTYGDPQNGTVIRVVVDRGFAFIRSGMDEYFMHHTDFSGEFASLKEGKTVVTFTPTKTPKGLRATYVSPATV
jgi:cold shock CspA family protein